MAVNVLSLCFIKDDVVQYLIKNNCPKNKIILGIPAYGRSYTLKLTANNAINAQVTGLGNPGKYSRTKGFVGYNEVCMCNYLLIE